MVKFGRILLFILLFLTLSTILSCSSTSSTKSNVPLSVTDQLGRLVVIQKTPQRIVSLAPSNTEILYALGLADRVVGITDYCNYPPEVKEKASIGGFSTPNIEQIVSLAPDLILADSLHESQVIPQLEAKGLTVFTLNPQSLDEVMQAITMVGDITRMDQAAVQLVSQMQHQITSITDKVSNLTETQKPRVFFVVWHDPLMTAGSGTLHDELIRLVGGINIAGNLNGYPDISLETVIAANPEVIIAGVGMGAGADATYQFAITENRLADISARQNNHIYAINSDLVDRTGPRIIIGLQKFAEFIHPELFHEVQ